MKAETLNLRLKDCTLQVLKRRINDMEKGVIELEENIKLDLLFDRILGKLCINVVIRPEDIKSVVVSQVYLDFATDDPRSIYADSAEGFVDVDSLPVDKCAKKEKEEICSLIKTLAEKYNVPQRRIVRLIQDCF